jgi:hypothetical protein
MPEAVTSGEKQKTSRLRLPCETQPLGTASEKIAMRCARLMLSGRTENAPTCKILAITAAKSIFLL